MPGMIGGIGCKTEFRDALLSGFTEIWGKCDTILTEDTFLAGHAFGGKAPLYGGPQGLQLGVDGEHAIYKNAARFAAGEDPSFLLISDGHVKPGVQCKGNVAVLDNRNKTLHLAVEWGGSFPLYYTTLGGGVLFSSHLRPLAKALHAEADMLGWMEYLKFAFIPEGRTFFKEIYRLQPGQALVYTSASGRLQLYENSQAWHDWEPPIIFKQLVEETWTIYEAAIRRCLEYSRQNGLMASGGWDTRLLLAGLRAMGDKGLLCYTHGDLKCKEVALTQKMVKDLGLKHHLQAIDGTMFAHENLRSGFARTEVINPLWQWAGRHLAETGVECVIAGVYGEVIGGRHGRHWPFLPISEQEKSRLVLSYLKYYRSNRHPEHPTDISKFYELLRLENLNKPWYIRRDFWESIPQLKAEMHAAMQKFVDRLEQRGVRSVEKICEAFTAEYFGSQTLMQQHLCCREYLDIAIPFVDQELWNLTSRIPLQFKLLHSLQQALLRYKANDLLAYPNAASFINSRFPLPVLEAMRVTRKLYEAIAWKISRMSRGYYAPQSIGWSNFAALGQCQALQNITDDLQCEWLDKEAIKDGVCMKIRELKTNPTMYPLNAMQNKLMAIYNADLMLN